MTFTEIYSDANFSISRSFGASIYKIERNYFKIMFKNISVKNKVIFNGYTYTGYFNGEEFIIEITDIARTCNYQLISFQFYDGDANLIYNYEDIDLINGISPNFYTKINLPSEIKVNFDVVSEFYIASSDSFFAYEYEHSECSTSYAVTSETLNIVQDGKQVKITKIDCPDKYSYLEWEGINGHLKSWFFLQDKLIINSDKKINLDTGSETYEVLKNKRIDFSLIEREANLSTQRYLSDIVFSDNVWCFVDGKKIKISIENNSITIGDKRQNISLTVNLFHYDTI